MSRKCYRDVYMDTLTGMQKKKKKKKKKKRANIDPVVLISSANSLRLRSYTVKNKPLKSFFFLFFFITSRKHVMSV